MSVYMAGLCYCLRLNLAVMTALENLSLCSCQKPMYTHVHKTLTATKVVKFPMRDNTARCSIPPHNVQSSSRQQQY